jgi:hypothetical protein
MFTPFRRLLGRIKVEDQRLLMFMANKVALRNPSRPGKRTK